MPYEARLALCACPREGAILLASVVLNATDAARLDGWGPYLTTSIWQKKNQERRESELRRAEQERDALSEAGRSRHKAILLLL